MPRCLACLCRSSEIVPALAESCTDVSAHCKQLQPRSTCSSVFIHSMAACCASCITHRNTFKPPALPYPDGLPLICFPHTLISIGDILTCRKQATSGTDSICTALSEHFSEGLVEALSELPQRSKNDGRVLAGRFPHEVSQRLHLSLSSSSTPVMHCLVAMPPAMVLPRMALQRHSSPCFCSP